MEHPSLAEQAIGDQAPNDYILRPEEHAAGLPKEAGALARLLTDDDIKAIMARYRGADSEAIEQQAIYKRLGRTAIVAQAMGVIVGALVIIPRLIEGDAVGALSTLELALILLGALAGGIVAWSSTFQKWNERRARAEVARIQFFQTLVSKTGNSASGELPLLPLQLEYFRRYQLQIQIAYYNRRGDQHRAAATRQRVINAVLALTTLALLANAIAGFWNAAWIEDSMVSVFLGVVMATVTAALANLSMIAQDESNAERYRATLSNLEEIRREYLGSAREAAAKGDRDGVLSFVAAVNDLVSLEHRQWVFLHEIATRPDTGPLGVLRLPKLKRASATKQ